MTAVADALEVERVESHLHPEGSFDVDDHVVPTGREEIWRFTPLKRLRGLHTDAPLDGATSASQTLAQKSPGNGSSLSAEWGRNDDRGTAHIPR